MRSGEAREWIAGVEAAQRVVEVHRTTNPVGPSSDVARLVIAMLDRTVPA